MFPAKLCVLLQMMRPFRGTKKDSIYWTIQILIWANFLFYTSVCFCFIFACRPRAKLQYPEIPGTCIDSNALLLSASIINVFSDFSIFLLPFYAIWKLNIAIKRKLAVAAVSVRDSCKASLCWVFFICENMLKQASQRLRLEHHGPHLPRSTDPYFGLHICYRYRRHVGVREKLRSPEPSRSNPPFQNRRIHDRNTRFGFSNDAPITAMVRDAHTSCSRLRTYQRPSRLTIQVSLSRERVWARQTEGFVPKSLLARKKSDLP